jgi:hypothetical protein
MGCFFVVPGLRSLMRWSFSGPKAQGRANCILGYVTYLLVLQQIPNASEIPVRLES